MNKLNLRSRRSRARLETLKKAGIWVFLFLFLFSIVGVTLFTTASAR